MDRYDYTEESIRSTVTDAEMEALKDGQVLKLKKRARLKALNIMKGKEVVEHPIGVVVEFFVSSPNTKDCFVVKDLFYLDAIQHRRCWQMNVSEIKVNRVVKQVMQTFSDVDELSYSIFKQDAAYMLSKIEDAKEKKG